MMRATVPAAVNAARCGGGGLHFLLRSPSEIKLKRRPLPFSLPGLGGGVASPAHSTVRFCTASNGGVAAPEAVVEVSDPLEERKKVRDAANTLDIRVGRILKAWRHDEAESLYVEEVDVGELEPRIICSGLVKYVPIENLEVRIFGLLLSFRCYFQLLLGICRAGMAYSNLALIRAT